VPTTGYRFPTADSAVSGTWTNTTNAYSDNGLVANCSITVKNTTAVRQYGTYGFSTGVLPDAAVIQTVNLRVDWRVASTGGVAILGCRARVGTTDLLIHEQAGEPTTLGVETFNITAERSWAPADFRDGTLFARLEPRNGNNATDPGYEFDYIAIEVVYAVPPVITATSSPFVHGIGGATVTGTTFETTQGTGKVELASSSTYASATKVLQTVTAWSALGTSIEFTPQIGSLTPGSLFLFVTSTSGGVSNGFAVSATFPPGAAWLAALNTPITVNVTSGNVQLRLRVGITNTGGGSSVTAYKWRFWYTGVTSGPFTDVTSISSPVRTFLTSHFADADDVPQLITGGSYQADNNAAEESTGALTLPAGLAGSTSFESEIALEIIAAAVNDTDTLEFELFQADNTPLDTYTEVPLMTIQKAVAAASLVIPMGMPRRSLVVI
jgi:hypothetical protein